MSQDAAAALAARVALLEAGSLSVAQYVGVLPPSADLCVCRPVQSHLQCRCNAHRLCLHTGRAAGALESRGDVQQDNVPVLQVPFHFAHPQGLASESRDSNLLVAPTGMRKSF